MREEGERISLFSRSEAHTVELGRVLGMNLANSMIVALIGELGSGKTCLVHGVAMGLGVAPQEGVSSPSFALIHEYKGRVPLYHMDLFRLGPEEVGPELGLDEYMGADGVCVIEWADRIPWLQEQDHLEIRLSILDRQSRCIEMIPHGDMYVELIGRLREEMVNRMQGLPEQGLKR